MRVLIVASYYWPEEIGTAPYVTGLAEFLAGRGHTVSVATGYPHYPSPPEGGRRPAWSRETRAGVTIRRRWHHFPGSLSVRERALYEGSLVAGGVTALGGGGRPDVVLGFIPSLAAAILTRIAGTVHRRPYGLVIHDLLGAGMRQTGLGGSRAAGAVGRLEMGVARGAEAVGIISEEFRPYFEQGGVEPDRIQSLRIWAQEATASRPPAEARRRLGWGDDEFVCVHAGNMGQKQGLGTLVEAAELLEGTSVRTVLAGDGNDRARLEAMAAEKGLRGLTFLGLQDPGDHRAMLEAADLLLVNQRASVGDMALPSKLTSYFLAGRPVVAAVSPGSATEGEMRAAGAGVVVGPEDPAALAEAIESVAGMDDRGRELGENGRRYAAATLAAEPVLRQYEDFLERLAAAGG